MPCQYPGSTWHPVVIRNASIVNAWLSEIRRTTAKTREDTMTVKVELPMPRQPYLESGLVPADFYAYEELLSEPEREKILNGSGHRPIRALQGNLTGIAYVEVPIGGAA
jgi:hypothetical protein